MLQIVRAPVHNHNVSTWRFQSIRNAYTSMMSLPNILIILTKDLTPGLHLLHPWGFDSESLKNPKKEKKNSFHGSRDKFLSPSAVI